MNDDNRRYVVAIKMGDDSPVEYVETVKGTGLDTVRLAFTWTTNIRKALTWTMRDLVGSGNAFMDVRCGFSRCALRNAPSP